MNSHLCVSFWLGLLVRAKSIEIGVNPEDNKEWIRIIPVDVRKETDEIVCNVNEIRSIELIKK